MAMVVQVDNIDSDEPEELEPEPEPKPAAKDDTIKLEFCWHNFPH